ncbi:putative cholinesterase [Heterostelium album PN500]|uniref:Carboxylic ester hydrolase n=1 Tax=Heterostelium pallidum (strain ATCC 26659 / Pp 5 / PN500) TaxID=670386 RepID=D3BRF5_HETP5|nr:putative cholinesterase [Heterostelium album PN500]EFA75987.1 putative cholinesterase [Heterostelium album PN500]|eukprot:XP_020428121.1 putative cholinesterase [Heterostelium album PN500]
MSRSTPIVASTVTVEIDDGLINGVGHDTHNSFLGIPFAQPPVGNLRFASPQPPTPWGQSAYDASFNRPDCLQDCQMPAGVCPNVTSEDCLYLDVYAPIQADPSAGPLPVMIFYPGGRFTMGGIAPLYEGGNFVNRSSVILVVTNYRLGVFGFMISPELKGNYGFEDQLLALNWVHDNIKAFGGDPSQVTVFGESAGGTSAGIHLISPASAGLMKGIIIESDPLSLPVKTYDQMISLAEAFSKDLGCKIDDLNCMLGKTGEEIFIASNNTMNKVNILHPLFSFLPWTPVIDGALIPDQPLALIEKGQFNKVPVMLGTVFDEGLIFIASVATQISALEYNGALLDIFGRYAPQVHSHYKSSFNSSTGNYLDLMSLIGTDFVFQCPTRKVAVSLTAAGISDVYQYQFQHVSSFDAYTPNGFPMCKTHVCHGMELPYVFDSVRSTGQFNFTAEEQILSDQMVDYWTNFAKNSNPNIGNTPTIQWPAYTQSNDITLVLQTPISVESGLKKEFCDFWDSIGYEKFGSYDQDIFV